MLNQAEVINNTAFREALINVAGELKRGKGRNTFMVATSIPGWPDDSDPMEVYTLSTDQQGRVVFPHRLEQGRAVRRTVNDVLRDEFPNDRGVLEREGVDSPDDPKSGTVTLANLLRDYRKGPAPFRFTWSVAQCLDGKGQVVGIIERVAEGRENILLSRRPTASNTVRDGILEFRERGLSNG